MPLDEVTLYCQDCGNCKKAIKSLSKKKVRADKALQRARENKGCSLCGHEKTGHDGKIRDPGWAHSVEGGAFDFEPVDAIGIRGVICLQTAATASGMEGQLEVGGEYSVVFLHDRLEVYELTGGQMVADTSYSDISALEVGGPGEQTSGGGFIGGGFGLGGFAVGMAASTVLNKVTSRKSIQTLLRVESQIDSVGSAEWIFLTGVADTNAVDSTLRPISLRLSELARAKATQSSAVAASQTAPDKVTRLKELSELRDSGAIDEDEFGRLKNEIMSSWVSVSGVTDPFAALYAEIEELHRKVDAP